MAEEETPKEETTGSDAPAENAGDEPVAEAAPEPAADSAPEPEAAAPSAAPAPDAKTPEELAAEARAASRAARSAGSEEGRPVRAVAKYLRFSARKGRLVVDQIRGKSILDAATALTFSKRAAAREVMKVLKSAVANAENNHGMSADELYVEAAFVDEGPTFKRWKPRARGRVDRINKRTCHVTVVVNSAPIELLEGRRGASAPSRADRVAGSRKAESDAPAKKAKGTKGTAARKPAADKAERSKRVAASKAAGDKPATAAKAKKAKAAADAAPADDQETKEQGS